MKTKVSNSNVAAQIVEILKERGVEAKAENGEVVVTKNAQTALDTFKFRDWFKNQHDDCDCSSCLPGSF